ncbi:uncharacterized protein DUF1707 [Pseudonocardia hierapolitana]|uniref:Uncharacterized protein DUF1707 n=1 Tax=Pseudonocardia hierapolitana TaxID=1128676 RepID=A0A561T3Q4_9PSEU|nr:DUF1707 domain-containing protein [Pseudonocardia hierapolitana]TWF81739.1 uncharacterized protein DUF1707 [Pseudonocardia hierapolitana]
MPDETTARFLRVSDAEREHVVGLLQRATGSGLLDIDEFTRRVDTALAARTRGELNAVLLDLPGLTHPDRPAQVPAPARPPVHRPAPVVTDTGSDTGTGEVRSTLGSVSRRGVWDVPAHLVVRTTLGSAELDFTEARIPHEVVDIELDVVAASVELRLPAGARVEHGELQATLSGVENHVRPRADAPDGPLFRIRGSVRAGSVEIRPPHRSRWWRR